METNTDSFTKQYQKGDIISGSRLGKSGLFVPYPVPNNINDEQPMDLTQGQSTSIQEKIQFYPMARRRSRFYRHHNYLQEGHLKNLIKEDVIELQTTGTKHAEILTAAKSLFSKRTRTLYHWMYPNTPKQQIKMAVANSWDNLGSQEKQFYISQVLVKFGFGQCNLMVNPQLGGIKELPPLPDTMDCSYPNELQIAISSITSTDTALINNNNKEFKKKQGRPLGSRNKKTTLKMIDNLYKAAKDFQDDPELSRELESFDITFGKV